MSVSLRDWNDYRVKPGHRVRLASVQTDDHEWCADKDAGRELLKAYRAEIDDLLALLAAEQKRSVLIVLQGMDAAGKDSAVRRVFTGVNPQNCRVVSFKEPDREEQAHDYLWRIYRAMPARGELGVFNRSHYEDVLVGKTHGDLSPKEAKIRVRQIRDMERIWSENQTVLRKFFLHVSRKEQTKRFKARLDRPDKHWKVESSDFKDRKLWPKFQHVYEEIIEGTATEESPWYIVPADHKWYSDVVIAGVLLATLRHLHPRIPKPKLSETISDLK